jgi:imidazolonepropionase-like amidohydrolase
MHASSRWHVRATLLPDGTEPQEWWVADGRLLDSPVPDAIDLPGRWLLPGGLVDAHVHLTMNFGRLMPYADGSAELVKANTKAHRQRGILALRDAGYAWGGIPFESPDGPRLQRAGSLMAPPGRGYPKVCRNVNPEELLTAALEELADGAQWIKIIGDFPNASGDFFSAPATYPRELVAAMVHRVHSAGGKVMAHSTGLAAADLVEAGVDCIEHGMVLNPELLRSMADQGIVWSLTMGTAMKHVGQIAAEDSPAGRYIRRHLDRLRELVPQALDLGVQVVAGTDEIGTGELPTELQWLTQFGLTPQAALRAASTTARAALGFRAVEPGAEADLVTFHDDPRSDLTVLASPASVLCRGDRVV